MYNLQYLFCKGVALLPFVNEKRLLSSLDKVYYKLSDDESKFRNYCIQMANGDFV